MNTVPMREPDPNDDMGVTIDAILTRPALRIRYMKGDFDDWKSIIGDEDLEYGIRQLPEKEQAILEKYYLQQKTLLDISRDLDIPASVIGGYLIAIETRLIIYAYKEEKAGPCAVSLLQDKAGRHIPCRPWDQGGCYRK